MVRTQIYLTKNEREGLSALARATGKRQSQLIRDAVDRLLDRSSRHRRDTLVDAAAGIWKDRKDLPDFAALRAEWDRS